MEDGRDLGYPLGVWGFLVEFWGVLELLWGLLVANVVLSWFFFNFLGCSVVSSG